MPKRREKRLDYSRIIMKKFLQLTLLVGVIWSISGCVAQKRKDDLTGFGKFYHNQTARFNGYFNADVLYTEAVLNLETQHQDNYNQLLDIYPYRAVDNADAVRKDMDVAIEKVATVSKIHPGADWVQDCYVLMGKAQYLKQDYESAQATLEYYQEEFDPDSPRNRVRKSSAKKRAKSASGKTKKRSSSASSSKKRPAKTKKRPESKEKKTKESSSKTRSSKSRTSKTRPGSKKRPGSSSSKKGTKKRPASSRPRPASERPSSIEKEEDSVVTTEPEVEMPKEQPADKNESKSSNSETRKERKQEAQDEAEAKKEEMTSGLNSKKEYNQDKTGEGIFGHKQAYPEGQLWLARTYIDRQKYSNAEYLLNKIESDPRTYEDVLTEVQIARADLAIQQKQWEKAIPALEKSIDLTKVRLQRARLAFILGQIQSQLGNRRQAADAFEMVLKAKPDYEMSFNAQLNLLNNASASGQRNAAETLKELEKMLKDEKNKTYADQIHFTMARIYLDQGQRDLAIEQLKLAVETGGSNAPQLGESHYLLAILNFEDEAYVDAKANYDGALNNLNKNDIRYPEVQNMVDNLQDIVRHLATIELQDSLLALGNLTPEEQEDFVRELQKKSRKEADARARMAEAEKAEKNARAAIAARTTGRESSFWAYDDKEVRKQSRNFDKTWGDRQLMDDWRRNDLRANAAEAIEDSGADEVILSDADISRILTNVPTDNESRAKAEDDIMTAMMELGKLYRSKLSNYGKSVESLELLLDRFPNTKHRLDAWFYLYLSHEDLGNQSQAEKYRQLIIENYPESEYAKLLSDPDYAQKLLQERQALDRYYRETYAIFTGGNCEETNQRILQAQNDWGTDHELMAKFDLLGAMCVGQSDGVDEYIKALQKFVKKYPDTDEQVRAREIIRLLGGRDELGGGIGTENESLNFKIEDDKLHFIIVVLYNTDVVSLSDAKIKMSDYNGEFHKTDRLRLSHISLNTTADTPVILVRRFKNKGEALKYYDGVQRKTQRFLPEGTDYEIFAVNQSNWREIIRSKTVANYREFFEENYKDN